MSQITITIETDNAAFFTEEGDRLTTEAARLLHHIAERIAQGQARGTARDRNGNTVARFEWEGV